MFRKRKEKAMGRNYNSVAIRNKSPEERTHGPARLCVFKLQVQLSE